MEKLDVEVLACPNCRAPANISSATQDLTKPIRCLFCDTIYTLRQSQDDVEQLKKDFRALLDQVSVAMGSNGSTTADPDARHYIFNEKLYLSLKREIDRHVEGIENASEAPMVSLKALQGFHDYQPHPLLIAIGRENNFWLKKTSFSVSSQQLKDFAVVPQDKLKLRELQFRISSVRYLANIAQHLTTPLVPAYRVIHQNLQALHKEYQEYAQDLTNESYQSYIKALAARTSGDLLLLDLLISALDEEQGITPENALARLDHAKAQLEGARQQALKCTYSPLYTVPLRGGIQKDIQVASILYEVVKCFELVTHIQPVQFGLFYENLMAYVFSLTAISSTDQLLWLLRSVNRFLAARSGNWPLPVLMDWNGLNAAIERQQRTAFFGMVGEESQVLLHHFHPYWAAKLHYSEEINSVFGGKKPLRREGYILVDATSTGTPIVVLVGGNDPNLPAIETGTHNFNLLDKEVIALPALLPLRRAEEIMSDYKRQHTNELGIAPLEMIGVIYLPAASVRYKSKKTNREIVVGHVDGVNQRLSTTLKKTQQFLQQFAV